MPMAGYEDFEDCVTTIMRKKKIKRDNAKAYCGKIKANVEGKKRRRRRKKRK